MAQAVAELQKTGDNLLGVALNRLDSRSGGYYYYYYYYSDEERQRRRRSAAQERAMPGRKFGCPGSVSRPELSRASHGLKTGAGGAIDPAGRLCRVVTCSQLILQASALYSAAKSKCSSSSAVKRSIFCGCWKRLRPK